LFYLLLGGLVVGMLCPQLVALSWFPEGPDGGSARAFGVDPKDPLHLYLGTTNGWVYQTRDGGHTWGRLARLGNRDDLVLDNILVDSADPRHVLVGAFVPVGKPDGGLFISNDGGATWASQQQMAGKSIRSLSQAPSDPKIIVVGALDGVFRSSDRGAHWQLISPLDDKEIRDVESLAIDPTDPGIIYAGTWHLPWKTADGGANWKPIKKGIIEDSDVFSIIIDPKQPNVVYASACSGIYKSENAGEEFLKAKGIPSDARRTRVLLQDPTHLDTVYAGTTEGLYRTDDAGKYWTPATGSEVIINDVYVDPSNPKRVLLATDRGGVRASDDGGTSFAPSNTGFSVRQITGYAADARSPATLYIGVVNDKEWGGVFVSHSGGVSWSQLSAGLEGRDVFSLVQAPDNTILAGTGHGIFRLKGQSWLRAGEREPAVTLPDGPKVTAAKPAAAKARTREVLSKPSIKQTTLPAFDGTVYSFAVSGNAVFAATSRGALRSVDSGMNWEPVPAITLDEPRYLAAAKSWVVAASLDGIEVSADGGNTWHAATLPEKVNQVSSISVDGLGQLWTGGRDGVYYSTDLGSSWRSIGSLHVRNVNSLYYDAAANRMLVSGTGPSTDAFAVQLPSMTVNFWNTGWNLRFVRPVGDHLLAGTLFDGIVVQPRMVDSVAPVPR
jgi:photosystem II stability/assembly factor-like uncharacterized protein